MENLENTERTERLVQVLNTENEAVLLASTTLTDDEIENALTTEEEAFEGFSEEERLEAWAEYIGEAFERVFLTEVTVDI